MGAGNTAPTKEELREKAERDLRMARYAIEKFRQRDHTKRRRRRRAKNW